MNIGMRKRNINLAIANKMNKWLATLPEELQKVAKRDLIVTGGCIASMLLGEKVNDYDVYFKTYSTTLAIAEHYVQRFEAAQVHKYADGVKYTMTVETIKDSTDRERIRIKVKSAGVAGERSTEVYQYFEAQPDEMAGRYLEDVFDQDYESDPVDPNKAPYRPVFLSTNAITLADQVQIIVRFFGDAEAIHENFDFVHCMNYWTFQDGVILNTASLEALMSKTLVYNGSLYPLCSIFRAKKFIQRGWNINAGQYLKMVLQLHKLDLEDHKILEEQLTGVDAAYFSELLEKARDKDNPERVDTAYLMELIERMF